MTETPEARKAGYNLSSEDRRQVILRALAPEANITALAREYGVTRKAIYKLLGNAMRDPKHKMHDAEDEAAFRRRVWELVR